MDSEGERKRRDGAHSVKKPGASALEWEDRRAVERRSGTAEPMKRYLPGENVEAQRNSTRGARRGGDIAAGTSTDEGSEGDPPQEAVILQEDDESWGAPKGAKDQKGRQSRKRQANSGPANTLRSNWHLGVRAQAKASRRQVKLERGAAASVAGRFGGEIPRGGETQEGSGSSCGSPRRSRVEFLQREKP